MNNANNANSINEKAQEIIASLKVNDEGKIFYDNKWVSPQLARLLILAKLREEKDATGDAGARSAQPDKITSVNDAHATHTTQNNTQNTQSIVWDEAQRAAIENIREMRSFVLTGAAGTGKTTCVNAGLRALHEEKKLRTEVFRDPHGGINDQSAKYAIAIVAFTNRAVNNMTTRLQESDPELYNIYCDNYMTVHKLLEYAPEYYEEWDEKTRSYRTKVRFEPRRTKENKLPLQCLIVEEAGMLDMFLWRKLRDALPDDCAIIFLGDIHQLRPVFGDSILAFATRDLPVVKLEKVYRQALQSPIIAAAYNILNLRTPQNGTNEHTGDSFRIIPFTKRVHQLAAKKAFISLLRKAYLQGDYNPSEDIVLSAFNKQECGTKILNAEIAQFLDEEARARGEKRIVHEVIAGFEKHYFAIGDRVYVEKMDGRIVDIRRNGTYFGNIPLEASETLTRFGIYTGAESEGEGFDSNIDALFEMSPAGDALMNVDNATNAEEDDRVRAASHVIDVELENGATITLSSAGEVNAMSLGYAITTHKAQGCEFERVFVLLHDRHTLVASNEWLYTAVTRARKHCYIITTEHALQRTLARKKYKEHTVAAMRAEFDEQFTEKWAKLEEDKKKYYRNLWPLQMPRAQRGE